MDVRVDIVEEPTGPRVVPALRHEAPETARHALAARRARLFMQCRTGILVFAVGILAMARLSGALDIAAWRRSLAACGLTSLVTALGWALIRAPIGPRRLVVGLLVVDALVGYPAVFVSGGVSAPAATCILLCLVMTPLFAGRRFLLPMAALHLALFSVWFYLGTAGHLNAWLPSDAVQVLTATQRFNHLMAYTIFCFGLTILLRVPSLDAALQRVVLADQAERSTAALDRTSHKLATANADLAGLNDQLQSTNAELTSVNAELGSALSELGVVNDQLGRSNAELARTNQELEHTNHALQRSNERLDQFNTAVSHDLRAPLQAMMARAELAALAAHTDPSRVARMADQICESATRMALQLDELHKLSRLEDRLEAVEMVPLGALLGQIVHDLEPKIRARRVNLEVVHPLPHMMGSRPLLAELFQNLLDNAIKYGAVDQPRVRVEALDCELGWVGAAVEDNGPGIPADQRTRVFELFRRLTRDQEAEGVGAGLAIVRRIVAVHGGTVAVADASDLGGARFEVRLPASELDGREPDSPQEPSAPPSRLGGSVGEA